jgi:hypothetical protein
MDGGNTTVRLFVTSAVLQRLVTFEFRLEHRIRDLCGRELARDGDGSVDIYVECEIAIASKLAPTVGWRCNGHLYQNKETPLS